MKILSVSFVIIIVLFHKAYAQDAFVCGDSITDSRDGQKYGTVKIGGQCWMSGNLNVGKAVPDFQQKNNNEIEKTCYENNPLNCNIYGGLYTWHEVMQWQQEEGVQGICPEGWHLPSKAEWQELDKFLGIEESGQKMKVSSTHEPSWDGNNESGFTAIPSGVGYEQYFGRLGDWAVYWSSTEKNEDYAWFSQLDNFWYPVPPKYKILYIGNFFVKGNGFSVRCVKDSK
jgi:uncharacterized protein (TIGR02145 family)